MIFRKALTVFLIWRIALLLIAFLSTFFISQFGSRFPYADQVLKITGLPSWVWGFGNFDGVHYLRIAQNGYNAQYSQAFFPLFPLLIRIINSLDIFPKDLVLDTRIFVDPSYFIVGLVLSNVFFLSALILFYKLIRLDFNQKVAFASLILLVTFPTSFYFGAIYTESLFLFLSMGAMYFTRKNNFLIAGVFSLLASATRIFGLVIILFLIVEIYLKFKKKEIIIRSEELTKMIIGILLTPFGLLLYMLYLRLNFDNPLYFFTSQPNFGAARSSENLVLLPQVIYRYIKIFITVPKTSQLFFNAFLEFSFTIITLIILLVFFKKMRVSYFIFTLGCLILPTLTGTFSSMPRYALLGFLLLPYIYQSTERYFKVLVIIFIIIGIILTSIFVRGYWVA